MARTTPFQFSLRRVLMLVAEFGLLLLVARLTWLHFISLKLGVGRSLFAVLVIALIRSSGLISGGLFALAAISFAIKSPRAAERPRSWPLLVPAALFAADAVYEKSIHGDAIRIDLCLFLPALGGSLVFGLASWLTESAAWTPRGSAGPSATGRALSADLMIVVRHAAIVTLLGIAAATLFLVIQQMAVIPVP